MKLLHLGSAIDKPYSSQLTRLFPTHTIESLYTDDFSSMQAIVNKARSYEGVITSSPKVVGLFADTNLATYDLVEDVEEGTNYLYEEEVQTRKGKSIEDYQGSLFSLPSGKRVVVIPPLKQLFTVAYAKFITKKFVAKITNPEVWLPTPKFNWMTVRTVDDCEKMQTHLNECAVIAVDIETKSNHYINMIGFCGAQVVNGTWELTSYVVELKNTEELTAWEARCYVKNVCENSVAKIFHNGIYDNTWLLHYGIATRAWYWDTLGLMHSLYCELPRSLAFTSAMFVRDVTFWKDMVGTDENEYNARDTYNTALAFLGIMKDFPDWAKTNYKMTFPLVAPAMMCGIEGVKIDEAKREKLLEEQHTRLDKNLAELQSVLGNEKFNPSSPVHTRNLLAILGHRPKATDKKEINKILEKDAFAGLLIERLFNYRKARKLLSSYLEVQDYKGRYTYSLNPFGTESGRFSSSKAHLYSHNKGSKFFRYGQQIQNTPSYAKKMLRADEGYLICELDKSASESWCTALISRDPKLWEVLSTTSDFHKSNANLFFGVAFEEVTKDLRQLAKPVNHGANYNMGAATLVETMTVKNVLKAKTLCLAAWEGKPEQALLRKQLLRCDTPVAIADFLLGRFHDTYRRLKAVWYKEIQAEIAKTGRLKNPSGFTRLCFGDPLKNKLDLNAYIAHNPQHLSVALVNRSFRKIWDELQDGVNFRMKAQIHDSILFQVKVGNEHLADRANQLMLLEVEVHGKKCVIPNGAIELTTFWNED